MLETVLFDLFKVRRNGRNFLPDMLLAGGRYIDSIRCYNGDLVILKRNDLIGMFKECRRIRGDKIFAF